MTESVKPQNVFWWIASIAVSVLCCAVLFVLFACYLCEVKDSIKSNEENLALIQQREDRILAEIEMLRKNVQPAQAQSADPSAAPSPDTSATGGSAPAPAGAAQAGAVPTTVAPAPASSSVTVPTVLAVPPSPTAASASQVPQLTLPSINTPTEKK